MKTLIQILFILFLASNLVAEKHGLIIAIGDYPDDTFWPDISSHNDIPHVSSAFKILGFNVNNITILKDAEATKEQILKALQDLENKLAPGDIVYIHYSGHGQQVLDDNNDEIDGLDEAIVPSDSPLFFEKGVYEGENLIRDDLLGTITNRMRQKIGTEGQLLLVLDSCHSGSGTRGMGKARGTDKVMAPANFKKPNQAEEGNLDKNINSEDLAPMVSFFGASARELNYETVDHQKNPVGSLSFALSSILGEMKNSYSYAELFERVKLKMKGLAPNQKPQWEGPKDLFVLGAESNTSELLFPIKETINEFELIAEIGTMTGVFEGTVIELVSLDKNKTVTTGEVIKAYLTEADIELDEPYNPGENELMKIRVIEKVEAPIKCNIQNMIPIDSPMNSLAQEIIKSNLVVPVESNGDLYLQAEGNEIKLTMTDGTTLYQKAFSEKQARRITIKIQNEIKAFTQGKYLRSFDSDSPFFDLSLEIINVDCADQTKELSLIDDGPIQVGSCIKLKVQNNGKKAAYFSVLDIQPDNLINLIIPANSLGYTAEEYYLEPGESYMTNYTIEIGEPLGDEVLKLISSDEALDLSAIINTRGAATRGIGTNHPFEKILAATYQGSATRGAKVTKANVDQVETSNAYFTIVK